MKVPLSWLKDYVEIDLSINDLAYMLTNAGLEVEAVHFAGLPIPDLDRVEYKVSGMTWERDKLKIFSADSLNKVMWRSSSVTSTPSATASRIALERLVSICWLRSIAPKSSAWSRIRR